MSLNGLLGQLLRSGGDLVREGGKQLDTPGKKLLAGGLGAGLLFTDTGRDIAKIGGVAALGAVAYHAWNKYKAGQASGQAGAAQPEALPDATQDSDYMPADEGQREEIAKLLIAAMVNAAKADGVIDDEEQAAMLEHTEALKMTAPEQSLLFSELGKPFDMEPIVAGAKTPEIAAEVYAASVVAVGTPSPAETAYLKNLAGRLKLPQPVIDELHKTLGSAQPA